MSSYVSNVLRDSWRESSMNAPFKFCPMCGAKTGESTAACAACGEKLSSLVQHENSARRPVWNWIWAISFLGLNHYVAFSGGITYQSWLVVASTWLTLYILLRRR